MHLVDPSRADYHSYLMRLWSDRAQHVWHASLQSTATGQIYQFVSVEALVAFLVARLAESGDEAAAAESGPPQPEP